jgi:hypothetical protein
MLAYVAAQRALITHCTPGIPVPQPVAFQQDVDVAGEHRRVFDRFPIPTHELRSGWRRAGPRSGFETNRDGIGNTVAPDHAVWAYSAAESAVIAAGLPPDSTMKKIQLAWLTPTMSGGSR